MNPATCSFEVKALTNIDNSDKQNDNFFRSVYLFLFTLIQKLHSLNFSMDFLYWVFNYLTYRWHFVQIKLSSLLAANYGVLQGSILGPILFNLILADMASITPKSNCIQYADDSTLYWSCKINKKDTCIKELEKDISSIPK